jgi:hypothetical protein
MLKPWCSSRHLNIWYFQTRANRRTSGCQARFSWMKKQQKSMTYPSQTFSSAYNPTDNCCTAQGRFGKCVKNTKWIKNLSGPLLPHGPVAISRRRASVSDANIQLCIHEWRYKVCWKQYLNKTKKYFYTNYSYLWKSYLPVDQLEGISEALPSFDLTNAVPSMCSSNLKIVNTPIG